MFAAGVYLGVGLSSASAVLDEAYGWRNAVRLVGLICFCCAFLLIFLKEPIRNRTNLALIKPVEIKELE